MSLHYNIRLFRNSFYLPHLGEGTGAGGGGGAVEPRVCVGWVWVVRGGAEGGVAMPLKKVLCFIISALLEVKFLALKVS